MLLSIYDIILLIYLVTTTPQHKFDYRLQLYHSSLNSEQCQKLIICNIIWMQSHEYKCC